MKIPEKVRIGGVEYFVEHKSEVNDGSRVCYGKIDYENNIIQLSTTRGNGHQHKCITLLHEIFHGIREHACLEIDDEENIVDVFAKGMYQVLQDNGARFFDIDTQDNVVRCANCVNYRADKDKGGFCNRSGSPSMWRDDVTSLRPDDYCSYGVRKNLYREI